MVQALNSTDWKPTFQSAEKRFEEGSGKFKPPASNGLWLQKPSRRPAAARSAAKTAEDSATAAVAAAAGIQKAQKAFNTSTAATVDALRLAVEDGEVVATEWRPQRPTRREPPSTATKAAEVAKSPAKERGTGLDCRTFRSAEQLNPGGRRSSRVEHSGSHRRQRRAEDGALRKCPGMSRHRCRTHRKLQRSTSRSGRKARSSERPRP